MIAGRESNGEEWVACSEFSIFIFPLLCPEYYHVLRLCPCITVTDKITVRGQNFSFVVFVLHGDLQTKKIRYQVFKMCQPVLSTLYEFPHLNHAIIPEEGTTTTHIFIKEWLDQGHIACKKWRKVLNHIPCLQS